MLFDPVVAWRKLEAHLDTYTVPQMAAQLGLERTARGAAERPVQCPRFVCRSTKLTCSSHGWACLACGALGGAALLFAAHVAGWDGGEDDDAIADGFEALAREALFLGLIPSGDPNWSAYYEIIPRFGEWAHDQRGVFEGVDRQVRMVALAVCLARGGAVGMSIARVVSAMNARHCKPPLLPIELAESLTRAAGVAA